jgi:alpha-glucosidase
MVWEPGPGYGFTTGEPWLPFGTNRADASTAAAQEGDPHAPLERTRELLHVRRRLPALHDGATTWLTDTGPVLAVERGGSVVVALHVADPTADTASLELPGAAQLSYATHGDVEVVGTTLRLPPDTAALVELLGDAAP